MSDNPTTHSNTTLNVSVDNEGTVVTTLHILVITYHTNTSKWWMILVRSGIWYVGMVTHCKMVMAAVVHMYILYIYNALIFKCYFLQKFHSIEQTSFMMVSPSSTH